MFYTYFVAYSYRCANGCWDFANIEWTTQQPMENAAVRRELTDYIAAELPQATGAPGPYTVVISNWILQSTDCSEDAGAPQLQRLFGFDDDSIMKMTYFIAYSSNPHGTTLWHSGNAQLTLDQQMEVESVRATVADFIAQDLSRRFGGEHGVVISNWKLLWTTYPRDSRALPKG